ncbi:unnamed protein product, partial [Penicillium bialowiezense]
MIWSSWWKTITQDTLPCGIFPDSLRTSRNRQTVNDKTIEDVVNAHGFHAIDWSSITVLPRGKKEQRDGADDEDEDDADDSDGRPP